MRTAEGGRRQDREKTYIPPFSGLRSLSLALTCSPNVFAQILYVALRSLAVFIVVRPLRRDVICDRWMGEENDGRALIRAQAGSRRIVFGQSCSSFAEFNPVRTIRAFTLSTSADLWIFSSSCSDLFCIRLFT